MKDVFSSYFAENDERREKLWKECFFVFDTNVLTSIYKRSDDARDALYKVIQSLDERLWIPYQVIFELLGNRASIAHAQAGFYSAAIEELKVVLDNFDSATRHPFLSENLHNDFFKVSSEVIAELEVKRDFHDARMIKDDVKSALANMLSGKVGSRYSDEQLSKIVKEGEARYANKIPPGFEDINKHKGSQVFSDVCKRFGDLIIWKQVIEKAKELNKPVIMVTGEQKNDWWDRHGGKTIGPLPLLIQEFNDEVGQDFYLYSHHHFLDLANKYLEQDTSSEVIQEVRDAARNEAIKSAVGYGFVDVTMDSIEANVNVEWEDILFEESEVPLAHNTSLEDQVYLRRARKELMIKISALVMNRRMFTSVVRNRSRKGNSGDPEIAKYEAKISAINDEIIERKRYLALLDSRIVE
ncbi:PIN domain-containing protein [Pseudomonas extremaustralis]|uniref:PIN-like domain-containing protein n=1 Tax=Pseudomonas extremaustralis TaxID=359110 RepID=UPI0024107E97|nr:PIN domain-containing protein [Pseudomonas extremaustralis]MDG2968397.1 PIN domain-containing protein [Pseudomonas extremaustralis]